MTRTIRQDDRDYVDPAAFLFSAAALGEIRRLRAGFPGMTVGLSWAYAMRVHGPDGAVTQDLGDRLVVDLGPAAERVRAFIVIVDGSDLEIAIPAGVTSADRPMIGADERGRLTLLA